MNTLEEAPTLLDSAEYPARWTGYVGQEPAKRMLQIAVKSAKVRKAPLDHVLISHGTGGMGKTALAVLVAKAMNTNVHVVTGQVDILKARMIFAGMEDGDILFYDEIHQVMDGGRKKAEWLLNYLQDGMLPGPMGLEPAPRVTVIGATTDAGKLPETIVSRFPIQPPMMDYTVEEAAKIAVTNAKKIMGEYGLPALKKADATRIATAAAQNPRGIKRLLISLRDLALVREVKVTDGNYDIEKLLAYQGVTEDGLDRNAQRYLDVLAREFGGSAGAKSLEDRLQLAGLATTERLLMDKGFIAKTSTGRQITTPGIKRLRALAA